MLSLYAVDSSGSVCSFLGRGVVVDALYGLIRVGHVSEMMQMSLIIRWVLSSNRLAFDPV